MAHQTLSIKSSDILEPHGRRTDGWPVLGNSCAYSRHVPLAGPGEQEICDTSMYSDFVAVAGVRIIVGQIKKNAGNL